ncbi:MAG: S-layer homology domain-containing protein, partial [Firmicutes bacterium]|nr:S-layer homology domain-containing protein [Bacillota bacterium]
TEKAGYLFKGFFTETNEKFDFNTRIRENMTLTAKWESLYSGGSDYSGPAAPAKPPVQEEEKPVAEGKKFADVHGANHWAAAAVDFVTAKGLFQGTSEENFTPDGTMTRGMVAVVLHNLEGNPSPASAGTFPDVEAGTWYSDAVHWAAEKDLLTGYGNGNYGPGDALTREQLAAILWRYAESPESNHDLSSFADADKVSDYAKEAMAWANENGIIQGMGNGSLAPAAPATRAQVAQMMMNFLDK